MTIRRQANKGLQLPQRIAELRSDLLTWAGALGLIGLLAVASAWAVNRLLDPQVFPLRVVGIEGDFRHLSRDALQRAVTAAVRGGFFTVDVAEVRKAARVMPWVDQVSVRRIWPDKLQMTVTEQIPLAFWGEKDLVNIRGELFRPDPRTFPSGLPRFLGPDQTSGLVGARYRQMQERLAERDLRIRSIEVNHRRSWTLVLDNGLELKLGSDEWEGRLARFLKLYPSLQALGKGTIERIDLRYTNGFAIRWQAPVESDQSAPRVGLRRLHGPGFRGLRDGGPA